MALRRRIRELLAQNGSPRGIAGGFALGLGLSLVPVPFAGMLLALAVAPLLGLNLPATYFGSALVNPLTGSAFYFAELWIGATLLGAPLPSWSELSELDAVSWLSLAADLVGPFAVGGLVVAAVSATVSYAALWVLVLAVRRARDRAGPDAKSPGEASGG